MGFKGGDSFEVEAEGFKSVALLPSQSVTNESIK